MQILVTGANGFVGSALCEFLESAGHRVRRAVRQSTSNLEHAVGDIGPETRWGALLERSDAVVHLAARVHQLGDSGTESAAQYRRVNVLGTLNLAKQAAAAGVGRFVYLSSIKVNGDATEAGRSFSCFDAPSPNDPYGVSKMEAEWGVRDISGQAGMEFVIVRPPLVYGPGVRANFLTMMRMLWRGMPLPLGRVTQNRRSLIGVDNLNDLLATCLGHPRAANRIFLASDGEDLSTAGLLRRLGDALERPAWLVPVPIPVLEWGARALGRGDLARRLLGSLQVDISETREVLGWNPPVSVDEGLRRTVRGFLR